ncbi:MAG: preprotein translocase subunit SecY [Armatimonadetes bacterium]|nr:preprotein translocase subunit SecY [Armatimonadota bacterium]
MIRNLVTAWSIPEVRARILYVLQMMALFILGLHVPVPGVNLDRLEQLIQSNDILNLFDTFSGSALRRFTIFALGITPYINASIIMQLLTVAIPYFEQKQKEGESGRKEIARYTRYGTVALAIFQAVGLISLLSNAGTGSSAIFIGGALTKVQVVLSLAAGTCFLLWIGESITERGIGQGVSLVIFFSIMARLPLDVANTWKEVSTNFPGSILQVAALLALFLGTVVGIIYVTGGTRRIPIQHARRQVGGRMVQAQSSFLPFKVNAAGVMPIIFAITIMMFPATIASYFNNPQQPNSFASQFARGVMEWTTPPGKFHVASLIYAILILMFTYFYAAIQINIGDLTDNLKKAGSFVPGIRPGRPTQEYLDRVLTRITAAGALFLAVIGLVQYYIPSITGIGTFSLVGGTSLLIVVGVALDTMLNLESHLVMRNYEGFIRQSGRRGARSSGMSGLSLR